jgi:hypothetical protein
MNDCDSPSYNSLYLQSFYKKSKWHPLTSHRQTAGSRLEILFCVSERLRNQCDEEQSRLCFSLSLFELLRSIVFLQLKECVCNAGQSLYKNFHIFELSFLIDIVRVQSNSPYSERLCEIRDFLSPYLKFFIRNMGLNGMYANHRRFIRSYLFCYFRQASPYGSIYTQ